jgi:hypothetical protein
MYKLTQEQIDKCQPRYNHYGKSVTIAEVQNENKELRGIIANLKKAIYDIQIKDIKNSSLLTSDQIREKLGSTTLFENGYFYSRAKNNNPQSAMLALSNLLICLKNSTIVTGEYPLYKQMFIDCENSLDVAMHYYFNSNIVAEARECRNVQSLLTLLVNRGYASFDASSYEAMILEDDNPQPQNKQSET